MKDSFLALIEPTDFAKIPLMETFCYFYPSDSAWGQYYLSETDYYTSKHH